MMSARRASFLCGTRRSQARTRVPALVALLPLCMPLSAPPAAAQETGQGRELIPLTALVRDVFDDRGLRGAVIELEGVVTRYVTGEDGRAEIRLAAGTYLLTVRKGGYAELIGDLKVDAVPPDWVELAEVYWGLSTPIEYTGMRGGGCGAVLIWTRLGAA